MYKQTNISHVETIQMSVLRPIKSRPIKGCTIVLITILWVEGQGAQKCLLPFTLKWIYWKIYMYKQTKQFRFQFWDQSNLIFITGHGPQTGRCVLNDKRDRYGNITVCEIQSWYQSLQCIGFLHVYLYMICIM